MKVTLDTIVSLCKRRGFIFQSSEIYGGLSSVWDYGPLGAQLKKNVKDAWWKTCVLDRDDMEGLDAAILMHPKVWEASGHIKNFFDEWIDCKQCKERFRNDEEIYVKKKQCHKCGGKDLTEPRQFNLMLETHLGPVKDSAAVVYMRPETAQGIFVNYLNVLNSRHRKLPFGIAQIGKAYRNEITPKSFTFRTREFEQMEIEYFVKPGEDDKWHLIWIDERFAWYKKMGIKEENLRLRKHADDELAHYAKACSDIEYNFPFGWSELEGIANRQDFDLKQHQEFSGKDLTYFDDTTSTKYIPHVIEPSGGVDRATLAFLVDAYREEEVKGKKRVVLGFHRDLAPIKIAVLPLLKNRPEIIEAAKKIVKELKKNYACVYDDTAAIGKLYRRQDEIGTPYCLTVDVESLEDKKVTIRERDSMAQDRIDIEQLGKYFVEKFSG